MKNMIRTTMLFFVACLGLSGCNDFFDVKPGKQESVNNIFSDYYLSEKFLANIYTYTLDETTGERVYNGTADRYGGIWSSGSLEATYSDGGGWAGHPSRLWNQQGQTTPNSDYVTFWWSHFYKGIDKATMFINSIDGNDDFSGSGKDPLNKVRWKAQARALRAYYYFLLLRQYGPPVLLGNERLDVDDSEEDLSLPRSSVDEVVGFITTEFDAAAADLPAKFEGDNLGLFDAAQCKAFKAKVLLFAASPLFNGGAPFNTMKNRDGSALFPATEDPAKWDAAVAAYEEFMTDYVDTGLFALYDLAQVGGKPDFYENYRRASSGYHITDNPENICIKEVIHNDFQYCVTPYHNGNMPNGLSGGMGISVSQEFVDMFFTDKGLRIEDDPAYDASGTKTSTSGYSNPANPTTIYNAPGGAVLQQWERREPRFYTCVTYSGSNWLRPNGSVTIVTNFTQGGNSGLGAAAHDAPLTGYGFRKTAQSDALSGIEKSANHVSINLRLADMFLGYAEALAETGNLSEAITWVNKVRARAGVPGYGSGTDVNGLTMIDGDKIGDQQEVINRVRRERLIELALEGHRFFDVRRWMVADGSKTAEERGWIYPAYHAGGEGGQMNGLNITANGTAFFQKVPVQSPRFFDTRHYFFPISFDEVYRNDRMVQNLGWE